MCQFPQVVAFQEAVTQGACGCSRPPQAQMSSLRPTSLKPTLSKPHPQHSLAHGRRRASHDTSAKLSPIDVSVSPHGVSGQQSPSSAPTRNQGSTREAGAEVEGNGGRSGGATGRQLDSIVDEARAEVTFLQKMKRKCVKIMMQAYVIGWLGKYLYTQTCMLPLFILFFIRSDSGRPADCTTWEAPSTEGKSKATFATLPSADLEKCCTTRLSNLLLVWRVVQQGFIQDLVCGQGAAQALYQWMTVTPESQLPVLHATSLATQGQGWGSYQSLSSHSGSDQQGSESCHQRRRSRALSSDVDAATRALVAVMIKSNGAVTEAATFAR